MVLRTLATGILLTASAFAQMSLFPSPSYFREALRPPSTKVELQPPVKLADFVKEGADCAKDVVKDAAEKSAASAPKLDTEGMSIDAALDASQDSAAKKVATPPPTKCLLLSLKDYLGLVMANHTDVQTQFLTVESSRNSVTSAIGRIYDPSARVTFSPAWNYSDPAQNYNAALDPQGKSGGNGKSTSWPINLSYNQTLPGGQTLSFGGDGKKSNSWGSPTTYSSGFSAGITQHLMQGRGTYITRIPIMQAQNTLRGSEITMKDRILTLISNAESAYWSVLSAQESLYVSQKALDIQTDYFDYVKKQLELGAISKLEIFDSEQQMRSAEVTVTTNQFSLRNSQDSLRRQIGADLDPNVRNLAIVLTDLPDLSPAEAVVPDRDQVVAKAMSIAPSIKTAMLNLDTDELSLASAKNSLLPVIDLGLSYKANGSASSFWGPAGSSNALRQMFGLGSPSYGVSLTMNFPIRSRQNAMTMANSLITKKQHALALRSAQQTLQLNVLRALTSFESSLKSLELQRQARNSADLNYQAQYLRYKLGTNLQINVNDSLQRLATQDQQLVNAQISVRNNLLALWLATGELLDQRGIVVKP